MSRLIYFSNVTENTKRFVDRLGEDAKRIPLRPGDEPVEADEPYVLVVPTYGNQDERKVPAQVAHFLADKHNRELLRGVIAGGNINFGAEYCLAGRQIAAKAGVPLLYKFELIGTPHDIETVRNGLSTFWKQQEHAA